MKRRVIVIVLLALVGIGAYWYFTRPVHEIVITGIVTTDDVIASAQVQGRLDHLYVKQGDIVKKGDRLATIQPAQWQADMAFSESNQQQAATQVSQAQADLRFQELQSQNQIAQAEANLATSQAQVKEAQADEEKARLTWVHEEEAYKKGVESVQTYDAARTGYQSAQAHTEAVKKQALAALATLELAKSTQQQVAVHRSMLEASAHQLEAMAAQKEKAKVQLAYTEILSPISGIVDFRASREGEVVNPGQAIVTLIDPDDYWIRADVEETYVDRIHLGDKLKIHLPSGAARTGEVFYIAAVADFATQRDVSRTKRDIKTFEVRLHTDNADRSLAVGMTAYVTLPLEKSGQTTTAPRPDDTLTAGSMLAVDVQNLSKRFGDFTAVDSLKFNVDSGEVFGLLGPNGAGKSTLIRMLTTLLPPTSGTALINNIDIVKHPNQVRKIIGVIPQAMTSDLDLTADENMMIFAKLYGMPRQKRNTVITELLDAVDLAQWRHKPVKMFSGGMRRRLEIARGLVHEPSIFFLDEPTTGLDPVSRVAVWEMLSKLKSQRHLTILVTTHYMDEADKLCDRIAIVDHGKLVALDSPLKLKASVPGKNILEVSFASPPADWKQTLERLPEVADVKAQENIFRLSSDNGPKTAVALVEAAQQANITITSLNIQSTTLDDVFVHYTGHQLRDTLKTDAVYDVGVMYDRK